MESDQVAQYLRRFSKNNLAQLLRELHGVSLSHKRSSKDKIIEHLLQVPASYLVGGGDKDNNKYILDPLSGKFLPVHPIIPRKAHFELAKLPDPALELVLSEMTYDNLVVLSKSKKFTEKFQTPRFKQIILNAWLKKFPDVKILDGSDETINYYLFPDANRYILKKLFKKKPRLASSYDVIHFDSPVHTPQFEFGKFNRQDIDKLNLSQYWKIFDWGELIFYQGSNYYIITDKDLHVLHVLIDESSEFQSGDAGVDIYTLDDKLIVVNKGDVESILIINNGDIDNDLLFRGNLLNEEEPSVSNSLPKTCINLVAFEAFGRTMGYGVIVNNTIMVPKENIAKNTVERNFAKHIVVVFFDSLDTFYSVHKGDLVWGTIYATTLLPMIQNAHEDAYFTTMILKDDAISRDTSIIQVFSEPQNMSFRTGYIQSQYTSYEPPRFINSSFICKKLYCTFDININTASIIIYPQQTLRDVIPIGSLVILDDDKGNELVGFIESLSGSTEPDSFSVNVINVSKLISDR